MIYPLKGIRKKIESIRNIKPLKNIKKIYKENNNNNNAKYYNEFFNSTNIIDNQLYFPYQDFPSFNCNNNNLTNVNTNEQYIDGGPCSFLCLLLMLTFYYISIIITKLKNAIKK